MSCKCKTVQFLNNAKKTTKLGVANGKFETCRDAETGILKSETEMEKFSDLIEKQIYVTDRHKI